MELRAAGVDALTTGGEPAVLARTAGSPRQDRALDLGAQHLIDATLRRQDGAMHILAKVGTRVWLVVSPDGSAHSWPWQLAALGCTVIDLVVARRLWRDQAPHPAVRWGIDAADAGIWALTWSGPYTAAVVLIEPAVMRTTVTGGARRALAAALAVLSGFVAVRLAAGLDPFILDTALYLGFGVGLGIALAALVRREAETAWKTSRPHWEAERRAALLAGGNEVVTGIGADVIDRIQVTIMALTAAGVDAAARLRAAVGEHKRQLGERTRHGAVYLRGALDDYALATRREQPDVARHAFFDVSGSDGVVVLSNAQARALHRSLGAIDARGVCTARVVRQTATQLVLDVDRHHIELDTPRTAVHVSLLPAGLLALALYVFSMSDPTYAGVPLAVAVPAAAIALTLAALSRRLTRQVGRAAEPWLAVATVVPFFGLVGLFMTVVHFHGRAMVMPLTGPLVGLAFVLGVVVAPRRAITAARIALVVAALGVVQIHDAPPSGPFIAGQLVWSAIAYLGAHVTARAIFTLEAQLTSHWREAGIADVEAARHEAAQGEVDYLLHVITEGRALAGQAQPGPIRDVVESELERLHRRLLAG